MLQSKRGYLYRSLAARLPVGFRVLRIHTIARSLSLSRSLIEQQTHWLIPICCTRSCRCRVFQLLYMGVCSCVCVFCLCSVDVWMKYWWLCEDSSGGERGSYTSGSTRWRRAVVASVTAIVVVATAVRHRWQQQQQWHHSNKLKLFLYVFD